MGVASVGSQRCSFSPEQWDDLGQLGHLGKRKQAKSSIASTDASALSWRSGVSGTLGQLLLAEGAFLFTLSYQYSQRKGNVMIPFTYPHGSDTSILAVLREPCYMWASRPQHGLTVLQHREFLLPQKGWSAALWGPIQLPARLAGWITPWVSRICLSSATVKTEHLHLPPSAAIFCFSS